MAKLEAAYKTEMVHAVKAAGGYGRRYEDMYTVGDPDCIFILPNSVSVFAEVKRFTGFSFAPRPRQWVELDRIQKSSTKVAACVVGIKIDLDPVVFYIANNSKSIDIRVTRTWSHANFVTALEKYLA